jgi:hypothetical protein
MQDEKDKDAIAGGSQPQDDVLKGYGSQPGTLSEPPPPGPAGD